MDVVQIPTTGASQVPLLAIMISQSGFVSFIVFRKGLNQASQGCTLKMYTLTLNIEWPYSTQLLQKHSAKWYGMYTGGATSNPEVTLFIDVNVLYIYIVLRC